MVVRVYATRANQLFDNMELHAHGTRLSKGACNNRQCGLVVCIEVDRRLQRRLIYPYSLLPTILKERPQ
jgi:hypothetical protein